MAKIIQKIPAKINLTLDVKGKIGDMHEIESLVISVNVYTLNKITVIKSKQTRIRFHFRIDAPIIYNVLKIQLKASKLFQ